MEKSMEKSSLGMKLDGNIDRSEQLLMTLSTTTQSHPELYQKFHRFVAENKRQIKAIEREEKEEQPSTVFVDGDSERSWQTDQSVHLSSDEEEQQERKEKDASKPKLLKNVTNSKSAISLKPLKESKKPFCVETKPKENITSSTANLLRSSPSSKLLTQYKTTNSTTLKTNCKPGNQLKKTSTKPYFPRISGSKPTLKL